MAATMADMDFYMDARALDWNVSQASFVHFGRQLIYSLFVALHGVTCDLHYALLADFNFHSQLQLNGMPLFWGSWALQHLRWMGQDRSRQFGGGLCRLHHDHP